MWDKLKLNVLVFAAVAHLGKEGGVFTAKGIAQFSGVPVSTVYRHLRKYQDHMLIIKIERGKYVLDGMSSLWLDVYGPKHCQQYLWAYEKVDGELELNCGVKTVPMLDGLTYHVNMPASEDNGLNEVPF